MAQAQENKEQKRQDTSKGQEVSKRQHTQVEGRGQERGISRTRDLPPAALGPFGMMRRLSEEMDRMFEEFGLGRVPMALWPGARPSAMLDWSPRIEAFHHDNQFIVRAELPGLTGDDVKVELSDDMLTIEGERRQEKEERREDLFLTERSYGRFCRTIPLPEGVIGDSAQASFKDGVLEVAMDAPPAEARRGRQIEIQEASAGQKQQK